MIDLNVSPYYDDFNEAKGFYKILFRPGYAVQARELTQLQTMLQAQITRFGNHIFKDGSIVLPGGVYTSPVAYIKVLSTDVSVFSNATIEGQTSGARGKVIAISNNVEDGVCKIYFTYANGLTFSKNESVENEDSDSVSIVNVDNFTGTATSFSINDSVFYVNGYFVFCNSQTAIIGEDDAPVSARVGLLSEENIVTPTEDDSLLDPARGTFNFSAPGANRLSVSLTLKSYPYSLSDVDTDNASEDFIELARYIQGEAVYINTVPLYSELENTLARRTFDESGDYTVRPFSLKVEDHINGDNTQLSLKVEPGKAYVKGYEYETIAPTYVDINKARTAAFNNEFPSAINYGQYLYVFNPTGAADYTTSPTANLYNNTNFNAANIIGTARLKHVYFDSTIGSNDIYRLYVDNVILGGNSVASIRAVGTGATLSDGANLAVGQFHSNIEISRYEGNTVVLNTSENPAYIIELPKAYVANVDLSETSYESLTNLPVTFTVSGGQGVATATISDGKATFIDGKEAGDYLVHVSNPGTAAIPRGYRIKPSKLAVTWDSPTQLTLTYSGDIYSSNNNFSANLIAPVSVSSAGRTKSLATGTRTISNTSNSIAIWSNLISEVSLEKSDVFRLNSVKINDYWGGTYGYTNYFDLDTGQTELVYDHGKAYVKDGYLPVADYANVARSSNNLIGLSNAHIKDVVFDFQYFTHGGDPGPLTVESYSASGIEYSDIPTYTSPTGKVYNLRNCFDFRPRRVDGGSTFSQLYFGAPDTTLRTDFYNYLGRKARLVLTKERKFAVINGIASELPAVPMDVPDAMSLYILNIPPYTLSKDEVTFQFIDNRRYTMRDIGRIERRVEKLEYYTALSLLEKQAKDETILDPTTTIDRFKNGILVDSFAGHSVGDVSNPDYKCSIDFENRILRPRFSSQSFNFKFNSGTNHVKRGDLLTLNYDTEAFLNQPLASSWINLNPYNVFSWNGTVKLDPATDNWVDTQTRPDVIVNLNGENDVYTILADSVDNPASVGVRWNDWQTVINGTPQVQNNLSTSTAVTTEQVGDRLIEKTTTTVTNNQTTTVDTTISRVGLEISTGATRTVTRDIGSRIVDTSIVPFIRSRLINFIGTGLKPDTELSAYFDGINVTDYCTPAIEIKVSGNIPATAVKVVGETAGVTGNIMLARPGYIFVKMTGNAFSDASTITFYDDAEISVGTATATTIVYATDTDSVSGNILLRTNEFGEIAGTFYIPNNDQVKFRTGEKEFRLTDYFGKEATTAAATKYIAQGLSQSTERTLVATRVATVAIKPVQDFATITNSTTATVVSTTETFRDITPPPPPAVACAAIINGQGNRGRHTYELEFGSNVGLCGINYNAFTVPDRYTIVWNGREYSTGFVGSSTYNSQLQALGFPNVVGTGNGILRFNKTLASPTKATLIVDAPLQGTGWRYSMVCPGGANANATPNITPTYSFTFTASPTNLVFDGTNTAWNSSRVGNVNLRVIANDQNSSAKSVVYTFSATPNPGTNVTATKSSEARSLYGSSAWSSSLEKVSATNILSINSPTSDPFRNRVANVTCTATWYDGPNGTGSSLATQTATRRVNYRVVQPPPQIDPVAQTFFINAEQYPNGIFVDSINLYFRTKSTTAPVTVQIRPTVNGYPSSRDILPFAIATLLPDEVSVSTTGEVPTNFRFEAPVYLAPGEYSFVALCNSDQYTMYTAVIGDFLLNDPNTRITAQPAIGSLFKSQNASTWTPLQEEDVKFTLFRCKFDTSAPAEVTLYTDVPPSLGTVEYDVFYASGETVDFAATDIEYYYRTTDTSDNQDGFVRYQAGSNATLDERKHIKSNSPQDLQFKVKLTTTDDTISPVVDLNRLSTVLVQNIINNDSTGETSSVGGNSVARYITRKVTLAPGFESSDLKAFMLVNKPTNSDLKVYYKVAPVYDTFFEDNEWAEMTLESSGTLSETGWVEYKYKTPGETAIASGDKFKTFALKIVLLSSNSVRIPSIRDLRVIALDE